MKGIAKLWALLGALGAVNCAELPQLTEPPEEYALYRSSRVAPTLEQRLRSADRYLREAPDGPRSARVREWFASEEAKYYARAFDDLRRLRAYLELLPRGPHAAEVRARIRSLEARRMAKQQQLSADELAFRATEARLQGAEASRRAFIQELRRLAEQVASSEVLGRAPSELAPELLRGFASQSSYAPCAGETCSKLVELTFEVPLEGELQKRVALIETVLVLKDGRVVAARLAGPELWTRLGEALALRAMPNPTPAQRTDSLNRSVFVMRSLLEARFPAAECDRPLTPPAVLERSCRGLTARVIASSDPAQDDVLEIALSAR